MQLSIGYQGYLSMHNHEGHCNKMGEITSFLLGNSFNVKGPCPICFSYPEVVKNFVNSYLVKIYGRGGVTVGATGNLAMEPESYNTSAASPSSWTTLLNCSILLPYCKRL